MQRQEIPPPRPKERWLIGGRTVELRCLACSSWIPLYRTERGKPHCFCSSCGLQVFFRRMQSIAALEGFAAANRVDLVRVEGRPEAAPGGEARLSGAAEAAHPTE